MDKPRPPGGRRGIKHISRKSRRTGIGGEILKNVRITKKKQSGKREKAGNPSSARGEAGVSVPGFFCRGAGRYERQNVNFLLTNKQIKKNSCPRPSACGKIKHLLCRTLARVRGTVCFGFFVIGAGRVDEASGGAENLLNAAAVCRGLRTEFNNG